MEYFGLNDLKDLPPLEEFAQMAKDDGLVDENAVDVPAVSTTGDNSETNRAIAQTPDSGDADNNSGDNNLKEGVGQSGICFLLNR